LDDAYSDKDERAQFLKASGEIRPKEWLASCVLPWGAAKRVHACGLLSSKLAAGRRGAVAAISIGASWPGDDDHELSTRFGTVGRYRGAYPRAKIAMRYPNE
jgi:hypothetical protein